MEQKIKKNLMKQKKVFEAKYLFIKNYKEIIEKDFDLVRNITTKFPLKNKEFADFCVAIAEFLPPGIGKIKFSNKLSIIQSASIYNGIFGPSERFKFNKSIYSIYKFSNQQNNFIFLDVRTKNESNFISKDALPFVVLGIKENNNILNSNTRCPGICEYLGYNFILNDVNPSEIHEPFLALINSNIDTINETIEILKMKFEK